MRGVNGKYANIHEFPGFYGNDVHAPTMVPRPFLLLPETAWNETRSNIVYLVCIVWFVGGEVSFLASVLCTFFHV